MVEATAREGLTLTANIHRQIYIGLWVGYFFFLIFLTAQINFLLKHLCSLTQVVIWMTTFTSTRVVILKSNSTFT